MNGEHDKPKGGFEQWNQRRHDVSVWFIRSGGEAIDDKDLCSKSQRDYFLNYYKNYLHKKIVFYKLVRIFYTYKTFCDKYNIKYCMFVYNNIFNWTKNNFHTYRETF